MAYQSVFKRYELKYMLTLEQKEKVLAQIKPYMSLDKYGRTTIRNIYFDTNNYRLIRQSIDSRNYKEKLRMRSYAKTSPNSNVFVELKKKYDHIVYKRRIALSECEAIKWICEQKHCSINTQISSEVDYFMQYYKNLHPVLFLSYNREAYYAKDGSDFRITFDDTILCREENLSLESDVYGSSILEEGKVLMEIKCSGGIPLWMTQILSAEHIYKTSFSKYGTAYKNIIYPKISKQYLLQSKEENL